MMIIQSEYPFQNSGASTLDWIGQVEGRVIYACDLDALFGEGKGENQNMVQKTVQKYKDRFKEAWEELSDK
jgi:uncharacterized protein related to proFAR isomerase